MGILPKMIIWTRSSAQPVTAIAFQACPHRFVLAWQFYSNMSLWQGDIDLKFLIQDTIQLMGSDWRFNPPSQGIIPGLTPV